MAALAVALIAGVAIAARLYGNSAAATATAPVTQQSSSEIARQFVYTAPTRNDASIVLPPTVRSDLHQLGLEHRRVALTRVEADGSTTSSVVDLTPRAGHGTNAPVLKVPERADAEIDRIISTDIEGAINGAAARSGGRALYTGLTKIDFSGVPVTVISSALDLHDPTDFRRLQWSVPAGTVVRNATANGASAVLHGPVTFVVVPTTGDQPELAAAQKQYRNHVWGALLTAAGATKVTFVDATGSASSATTFAPVVPVPSDAGTPHRTGPTKKSVTRPTTCKVPSSYFRTDSAVLIDHQRTVDGLRDCVSRATQEQATFRLDGWTSYDGPLDSAGRPAVDDQGNRDLSRRRVRTIADLLVNDLGVERARITKTVGHGNTDQPSSNPRSAANRVVLITYTAKGNR